jgi:hypothetical protein
VAMAGEQHWFRTGICYFNVRGLAFQKKGGVLRNVFFVTKERCSNCHVFFHYFPRPRCLRLAYSNFNDAFNSACGPCDTCQLTRLSSTHGCTTRPSARLMLRMACKTRGRDAVAGAARASGLDAGFCICIAVITLPCRVRRCRFWFSVLFHA